jgi:hypothetical protein
MSEPASESQVGYRKPPQHTRFRKGRSDHQDVADDGRGAP